MGKIPQNIIDQIPILYEELKTKKAVAERLKISPTTVSKYLLLATSDKKAITKERKERTKITPEIIEQINELYKNYRNMAKVARELKISNATVKRYLSPDNLKLVKENYDDRDALFFYIYRLFGPQDEKTPVSEWNLTQMEKFRQNGMPYRGQLLTLKYFYEVKHHKVRPEYKTIGIISHVWNEAALYYEKQEKNQEKILKEIEQQLLKDRIEIPFKPSDYMKNKKRRKKINLDELEVENE